MQRCTANLRCVLLNKSSIFHLFYAHFFIILYAGEYFAQFFIVILINIVSPIRNNLRKLVLLAYLL